MLAEAAASEVFSPAVSADRRTGSDGGLVELPGGSLLACGSAQEGVRLSEDVDAGVGTGDRADAIDLAAATTWLGQPGYVVSVLSESEKDFLVSTFGGESLSLIGYTDRVEEGVWPWVSGEPSGYEFWASDEPNNANEGEDLAVMNWQHGFNRNHNHRERGTISPDGARGRRCCQEVDAVGVSSPCGGFDALEEVGV